MKIFFIQFQLHLPLKVFCPFNVGEEDIKSEVS